MTIDQIRAARALYDEGEQYRLKWLSAGLTLVSAQYRRRMWRAFNALDKLVQTRQVRHTTHYREIIAIDNPK